MRNEPTCYGSQQDPHGEVSMEDAENDQPAHDQWEFPECGVVVDVA